MSTSFSELRVDVAAVIDAISPVWSPSPVPHALFGPGAVPDAIPASKAHLMFAVGVQSERAADRQRVAVGALTLSAVSVRFFARYTPGDGIASEDAALDAEHALIKAVVAVATDFTIEWSASSRDLVDSGEWFVHDVDFSALHRVPLTQE